ncbi:hypothetical protein [Actinomadura bangladeshensis]|uniref:Uncharacterized protein n=1 Tax=Actinomadura bangladeshensis TaxID=453573 RepID=A0A6L9QC35_9ACTN|nr:hypothetical protein [Actinomadura bangladeshensis]NEA22606.1 hypothetical protein [Actinomadura bangladeshensis]
MAYVARIIRKDGSMVEKDCATMEDGERWVTQNKRRDDRGNAVVRKS